MDGGGVGAPAASRPSRPAGPSAPAGPAGPAGPAAPVRPLGPRTFQMSGDSLPRQFSPGLTILSAPPGLTQPRMTPSCASIRVVMLSATAPATLTIAPHTILTEPLRMPIVTSVEPGGSTLWQNCATTLSAAAGRTVGSNDHRGENCRTQTRAAGDYNAPGGDDMRRLVLCVFVVFSVAVAGVADAVAQSVCDRACLRTMLDQYLNAVIKHEPAAAPLVVGFRQTENAVNVRPGNGVWKTVTGLGAMQRRYLDEVSGQAAYYGIVQESAESAIVTVRVRVENRKLTEA